MLQKRSIKMRAHRNTKTLGWNSSHTLKQIFIEVDSTEIGISLIKSHTFSKISKISISIDSVYLIACSLAASRGLLLIIPYSAYNTLCHAIAMHLEILLFSCLQMWKGTIKVTFQLKLLFIADETITCSASVMLSIFCGNSMH